MTFEGLKDQMLDLSGVIERRRNGKKIERKTATRRKKKKKQTKGGNKELKRLKTSINYDNREKKDKSSGGRGEICKLLLDV